VETRTVQRWCIVFGFGAVFGTLGDFGHSHFGVLHYPRPFLAGEAWWVPLLFGGSAVVMIAMHNTLRAWLPDPRATTFRDVAVAAAWFGGSYLASSIFKAYPLALTVALTSSFVARMLVVRRTRLQWIYAASGAIGGPCVEILLSSTGAFRYDVPDHLGVPIWLPALYLQAALLGDAIARAWKFGPAIARA